MKKSKKLLWLSLASVSLVSIATATPLILASCSNDNGNNSNNPGGNQNETKPTPPSTVDTSNIKTFAQALSFAKDYLNKYYTFDMFKSDVTEYLKKMNIPRPSGPQDNSKFEIIISDITTNADKTVNFLYKTISTSSSTTETVEFNCKNFNIVPIIVLDPNNKSICKIGIYIPYPTPIPFLNPEQTPKPESDFTGPKNDYSIYTNNSKTYYGGWTQSIINTDQNKIHYVEYLDWSNRNPEDVGCTETFSLNVSFLLNPAEITNNLIRPL